MNTYVRRKRTKHPDLRKQKFFGLVLIAISAIVLIFAFNGQTPMEQDATAVLFTLPLGLILLFAKSEWIV